MRTCALRRASLTASRSVVLLLSGYNFPHQFTLGVVIFQDPRGETPQSIAVWTNTLRVARRIFAIRFFDSGYCFQCGFWGARGQESAVLEIRDRQEMPVVSMTVGQRETSTGKPVPGRQDTPAAGELKDQPNNDSPQGNVQSISNRFPK
jgi:hypothetical protein